MAVSGSSDFNLITNEIIELAYKSINALRDGDILTGDQYSTGRKLLNMIQKNLGLLIWNQEIITVNLTASSVVLGSDGVDYECIRNPTSSTTNKPVTGSQYLSFWKKLTTTSGATWAASTAYTSICNPKLDTNIIDIENGLRRDKSSETNSQMTKITNEEFLNRYDTNSTAAPTQFWFKRKSTPELFLYPYPDSATNYVFEFNAYKYSDDMDSSTDNPDFPQEWLSPLTKLLAVELAPQRGITGQAFRDLVFLAENARKNAEEKDHETGSLYITPNTGGRY